MGTTKGRLAGVLALAMVATGAAAHPGDQGDWHPGDCKPGRFLFLNEPLIWGTDSENDDWEYEWRGPYRSGWQAVGQIRRVLELDVGGVELAIKETSAHFGHVDEDTSTGRPYSVGIHTRHHVIRYRLPAGNITGVMHRIECQHRPR